MSDSLVDWFKDRVTPLYESVSASGEGALSSRVGSLFEGDARIICNHEEVDLATFSKGLVASSSAVSEAHVEWKKVASLTAAQHSDAQQDAIVSGYFIVTRSMKFRIRAAPARILQHCFFSAKVKEGSRVISELFVTCTSEQAPVIL